jgi:hypothetical protein
MWRSCAGRPSAVWAIADSDGQNSTVHSIADSALSGPQCQGSATDRSWGGRVIWLARLIGRGRERTLPLGNDTPGQRHPGEPSAFDHAGTLSSADRNLSSAGAGFRERRMVPCAIEDLAAADNGDRSSTCRTRYRPARSAVCPARSPVRSAEPSRPWRAWCRDSRHGRAARPARRAAAPAECASPSGSESHAPGCCPPGRADRGSSRPGDPA